MDRGARRKATGVSTSRFRKLARAVERALARSSPLRKAHRQSIVEPLEERRLLATGVVINEFMADNNTGYTDPAFPGAHPDWIELYNPTVAAVNLQGWQLKDDSSTWTFPAGATIAANGFLVVAADSKNLTNPAAVMHTNFNLNKDGEYLGLIKPDTTVANEFAPAYPPQTSDISYGTISQNHTLPFVSPTAVLKAAIPANNAFDIANPNWKSSSFVDTGPQWISGQGGVGFDSNPGGPAAIPGWNVHMVRVSPGDFTNVSLATSVLNGNLPAGFTVATDNTSSPVAFIDYGENGHFANNGTLPNGATVAGGTGVATREEYALRSTANVTIPAGTYTIGVNSDDGFQLTIPGVTFSARFGENNAGGVNSAPNQLTYAAPRGASDTFGSFTLTSALSTTITVDMYEEHGGDSCEVYFASGAKTSVDASFALVQNGTFGWSVNTTAPSVPYAGQFGLNLQTQMLNVNSSAYIRIPFNVAAEDLPAFQSILLHMKYDDGFVAWINGLQVASANAPASPAFNSFATASNPNSQAVLFRDFSIPNAQTYIHAGLNVLAIQAMNLTAADADFLNVATLDGVTGTVDVPRFFSPATPGAANTGGLIGQVKDTKFDHDRGFYSAPFNLVLSSDDTVNGATIKYTTDGTTPSPTNGIVYVAPITINKTSTIRAAAFRNGYLPTDIDTQTYIFLNDVITQSASSTNTGTPPPGWPASWSPNTTDYGMDPDVVGNPIYGATIKNDIQTIPTLSIVTDLNNLFGATGLYSNPGNSGIAWERPVSLELINPDGSTGFQINAGLRLRGGYSRSTGNPKHALRILLRDSYGSSTLNYPLFKSMDGTDQSRGFDIRTFENYSWSFEGNKGQFIGLRDQFSRDTQFAMGDNAERGDMYNLYIDGQYWGIYNTDERPEADNAVSYYGGTTDDYDTIKVDPQSGYTTLATDGTTAGWNAFWTLTNQLRAAADAGQDTNPLYQQLQGKNPNGTRNPAYPVYLDANNLIDYMLVIFYGGNLDAPISNFLSNTSPNNFYAIWNHTTKDMGFQYFAHDSEHTLLDVNANRLGPYTAGVSDFTKSNPQEIFQQLLYNADFRTLVADRIHKFLFNGGALTSAAALARFNARRDEINRAIVGESARWGDAKTGDGSAALYTDWQNAIATVTNNFLPNRTNNLLTQFKNQAMGDATVPFTIYPALAAPEFIEQFGGNFDPGFVAHLTAPGGIVYYTLDGSDPRLPGGTLNPNALVYNAANGIPLTDTTRIQARALNGTVWSAVTDATFVSTNIPGVRITEIMYHPVAPPVGSIYSASDFEYIEVQNITNQPINLKNYSFGSGVTFTFPNMVLAAGARTVVVANLAAFQSRYGNAIPVAGVFTGSLDNSGEKLQLNGALGQTIQSFTYSDSWYPQTDGEGYSLVVRDAAQSLSLAGSKLGWRASNSIGGDPDTSVATINPGSVVINEIGAKVATPNTTFIELANTTNNPIDISGWFLSNDATGVNLKKYQFPVGSIIAANGYLLLNEQTSYGQAGNPAALAPFTLDGDGADTITLSQADGSGAFLGYREIQDYGAADVGQTLGRYVKSDGATDFVIQKTATPGVVNTGPVTSPVIINEVMYNPLVKYTPSPSIIYPNPNLEYIELRNTTNAAVPLYDPANPSDTWRLTDGVDFAFPANTTIPANGYIVISNLLPADFRTAFNTAYGATALPATVPVYGPMSGFLNNGGEKISLQRPGTPGIGGVIPYINVDRLSYDNKAPWPVAPATTGVNPSTVTIIDAGAVWKYKDDNSNQGTAWIANNFPDAAWASGPAQLGYSEGQENDEATLINGGPVGAHFITTYFRKSFNVTNLASLGSVTMHLLVDDGAEVYLNGQAIPVASYNMPATWDFTTHANSAAPEGVFIDFPIDPSKLVEGTNYLAVEVHQVGPTSSDVSFDLRMDATKGTGQPTPGFSLIRTFPLNYGNDPNNWQASHMFAGASLGFTPGAANLPPAPPVVSLGVSTATVNENTVFTLNGSFSDPDLGQTWPTQKVDWGDGTVENFTSLADNTFSLTHTYKDNSATAFKPTVTITDSGALSGSNSASVTVSNSAPTGALAVVGGSTIAEGGSGSISLTSVNDPSYIDANAGLKYSIDWNNDGIYDLVDSAFPLPSPANTTTPGDVSASIAIPGSLLADGPGTKTIKAKITDKDGGFTEYTTTVTVSNVAPVVATIPDQNDAAPFVLNYTTGAFTDPGTLDTWTGSVDWDYHAGDTDSVPLTLNADKSFTLNHAFNSAGTFVVRVRVTDKDGDVGFKDFTVTASGDTTPPTATDAQFLYQSGPRNVAIKFSEDVSASLQVSDLTVHNIDANTNVPAGAITLAWDALTNTATWTFSSLDNANYHATLSGAGVTDAANNAMASDTTLDFWFLNGDADRDRSVGFADLVVLAQNYGATSGQTLATGDMDGDGAVGFADLVVVGQNYGKTLAPLPAAVPAPVAAAAPIASAVATETAAVAASEAVAPVAAAPTRAALPPVPAPAKSVAVNTPPTSGIVKVVQPIAKPVSKAKPVPVIAPTFSTSRIATAGKKRSDLFD